MAEHHFQKGNTLGKDHRFKPGQSGNPGGRPKDFLSAAYRTLLEDEEIAKAIAKAIVKKAMRGSVAHAAELADRTEGKPRQSVEIEQDEFALNITLVE